MEPPGSADYNSLNFILKYRLFSQEMLTEHPFVNRFIKLVQPGKSLQIILFFLIHSGYLSSFQRLPQFLQAVQQPGFPFPAACQLLLFLRLTAQNSARPGQKPVGTGKVADSGAAWRTQLILPL